MYKAGDVANLRGAKMIGIEDILFLMRKDKVKVSANNTTQSMGKHNRPTSDCLIKDDCCQKKIGSLA